MATFRITSNGRTKKSRKKNNGLATPSNNEQSVWEWNYLPVGWFLPSFWSPPLSLSLSINDTLWMRYIHFHPEETLEQQPNPLEVNFRHVIVHPRSLLFSCIRFSLFFYFFFHLFCSLCTFNFQWCCFYLSLPFRTNAVHCQSVRFKHASMYRKIKRL